MIERNSDKLNLKQLKIDDLEDTTPVIFYDPNFDLKIEVDGGRIKRTQQVLEKHQKEIGLTKIPGGQVMAVIDLSRLVRQVEKKE